MKFKHIIIVLILLFYAILFNYDWILPQDPSFYSLDKSSFEKYYSFLESIIHSPAADQINRLKEYLLVNQNFEQAYLKLLERYLLYDRINDAELEFQNLSANPLCKRNSSWMLAKLYMIQDKPDAALKAFKQALCSGTLSATLIEDFIEFDSQQLGRFNGKNQLSKLCLDTEILNIVLALYKYQAKDYKQTLAILSNLSVQKLHRSYFVTILGNCYYHHAQYAKADSIWRTGLKISRNEGNKQAEAYFLRNIGLIARSAKKYNLAINYYDSSYAIANRLDDLFLKQLITASQGNIFHIIGAYNQATMKYKEAIYFASKIGEYSYSMFWHENLAQRLLETGNFYESLREYDQSEEFAKKINDETELLDLRLRKAVLYSFLNQQLFAKKVFEEVSNKASALNKREIQYRSQAELANLLIIDKEYDKARKIYLQYIDYLNNNGDIRRSAYWTAKVGESFEEEKKYELAKEKYLQALNLGKSTNYSPWYLLKVADMETIIGKVDDAITMCDEVIETAISDSNTLLLLEAYNSLGNAYKKKGDLHTAISCYIKAVDLVEKSRRHLAIDQLKIGFFSTRTKTYRNLVHCFLKRYEKAGEIVDLDSLFYYSDLYRAKTLQDKKAKEQVYYDSTKYNEYSEACKQLRAIQNHLYLQACGLLPIRKEKKQLILELEAMRYTLLDRRLKLFRTDTVTMEVPFKKSVQSIRKVIHDIELNDFGLLLYHITDEESFVLVSKGKEVKIVQLNIELPSLKLLIDSLINCFHITSKDSIKPLFKAEVAHQLYELLLKPIEDSLSLPKNLLVVSDLAMMNLPFEMLLTEMPDKREYLPSDFPSYANKFLIHRYTFAYSPCVSILNSKQRYISKDPKFLVLYNPCLEFDNPVSREFTDQLKLQTGWSFEPLAHSEKTATWIKNNFSSSKTFRGQAATEFNLRQNLAKRKILHFDTHGFADLKYDAFSGLVLARGDSSIDDGFLMGYEIPDLNLDCDLVTLSACETGRGKLVAGEGILGLPRLFLSAGAKAVLMTLWKVDNKINSEIIINYYHNFLKDTLNIAEALSAAKDSLMNSNIMIEGNYCQHPFYWASFCLYGEPWISREREDNAMQYWIVLFSIIILATIFYFYLRYKHR